MNISSMSWATPKNALKVAGTGLGLAYLNYPDATEIGVLSAFAAGTVYAGYAATDWTIQFPHRWNWINPLHATLCGPLGVPEDTRGSSYIKIHRNYHKREDVGVINLPATFTGVDQSTVTTIVKNKLGLTDVTVAYKLAGRKPHLVIRQTPRPPARVLFADHMALVTGAKESAPVIGVGPQMSTVSVDLDADSPHILVSASTGGGKSVITRTMASQMLHHGSQMVVLDFKRISHRWAAKLPQVNYCKEISEIHNALVELGREGHRRNKAVDAWEGDEADAPVGPRMAILLEEANATVSKLKRYWTSIRKTKADEDGPADPKESPAIDALRETLFMGRAVRMHVLMVAQSATAAALGGPEVRECFATRILARYTQNAWKMLVPEVSPIPRSTRHIGRAQVVLGGVAKETQVMFMSEQEATQWALSGIVADAPNVSRHAVTYTHVPALTSDDECDVTESVTPLLSVVKATERRYSLAEASREGIVPMTADALRQAKRRSGFPHSRDGKWTARELVDWYASRAAKSA